MALAPNIESMVRISFVVLAMVKAEDARST